MKTLLVLLLTILETTAFSQDNPPGPPFKMSGDRTCVYKPTYSAAQRLRFYPFNVADTIKLVSFWHHNRDHPIKKDSLLVDSLVEIKVLSKTAINQLTNILYNNFYKKPPNYGVSSQCFFPRNAILFFDKNGKMIESIVVCFHCNNFETGSEKVEMGDECGQKIDKIRKFFVAKGLRLGTDLSISLYPGERFGDPSVLPPEKTE
jgi:hypothetical protein